MTRPSWEEQLGDYMREGFKGIHDRLDTQNGRVRSNEVKIAWIMGVGAAVVFIVGAYLGISAQ